MRSESKNRKLFTIAPNNSCTNDRRYAKSQQIYKYTWLPNIQTRQTRRWGGGLGEVMFYVKEHLKCKEITWPAAINLECLGLNFILSPQRSIILIRLYRPPSAPSTFYEEMQAVLKDCNWKKEVILLGDFNVDWLEKSTRKRLKLITNKHDLSEVIEGPTRISK